MEDEQSEECKRKDTLQSSAGKAVKYRGAIHTLGIFACTFCVHILSLKKKKTHPREYTHTRKHTQTNRNTSV